MTVQSPAEIGREKDGFAAIFRTRAEAELAIEHLAQEYGIDSAFIYVEPLDDQNSAGIATSGGDHASRIPSHGERRDAPLHGTIQVTVLFEHERFGNVEHALMESGAITVEPF